MAKYLWITKNSGKIYILRVNMEVMKTTDREKICISCEGRIAVDATRCPYCATEQKGTEAKAFQTPLFQNQSLEESLTSLYTPPYKGKNPQFGSSQLPEEAEEEYEEEYYEEEVVEKQSDSPLVPTLLLSAGANLAVLGLMQLFFSHKGILHLEWNAKYWFFYLLLSAPFLYFGYKRAQSK